MSSAVISAVSTGVDHLHMQVGERLEQIRARGGFRLGEALLAATVATVLWYGLLFPFAGQYLHMLFYERGWIPYMCTWLFFLSLSLLTLKLLRLNRELKAPESTLCRSLLSLLGEVRQDAAGVQEKLKDLLAQHPKDKNLVVINRLCKGISQDLIGASSGEAGSVMSEQSETDSQIAESSYFLIRFLIWVVPILGFVGTVLGIAKAVSNFDAIVAGSTSLQSIKAQMGTITGSLGLAFETTLIALVMSALMMLAFALIQKREEDMLAVVDQFTMEQLVSRPADGRSPDAEPDAPKVGGEVTTLVDEPPDSHKILVDLHELQESYGKELEKLRCSFEENATALGTARGIAESLRANKDLQARLEQTISEFNQVTGRYTETLRSIYNLKE